jgi:hypothetical protein
MNTLCEQLPMFIYCKDYLEVVAEVVLDQVSKILSLEHLIINGKSEGSEEIELNLSSSAMSFGQKERDELEDSLDQEYGERVKGRRDSDVPEFKASKAIFPSHNQTTHP